MNLFLIQKLRSEPQEQIERKKRQEDNLLTLTISTSNFESKREAELSENMAEYTILISIIQ
jgi:hypothetical protein